MLLQNGRKQYNIFLTDCKNNFEAFKHFSPCVILYLLEFAHLRKERKMLRRLKGILMEFFRQADLVLLGLCCAATVFGIVLIFSATRYMRSNRNVLVQSVALLLGICVYIALSHVDIEILMKKWILFQDLSYKQLNENPLQNQPPNPKQFLK